LWLDALHYVGRIVTGVEMSGSTSRVRLTLVAMSVAQQQEADGDEVYVKVTTIGADGKRQTTRHPGKRAHWKLRERHGEIFDREYGDGVERFDHVLIDQTMADGDSLELAFFEEDLLIDDKLNAVLIKLRETPDSGLLATFSMKGRDDFEALANGVGFSDRDIVRSSAPDGGVVVDGAFRITGHEQIGVHKAAYNVYLRFEGRATDSVPAASSEGEGEGEGEGGDSAPEV